MLVNAIEQDLTLATESAALERSRLDSSWTDVGAFEVSLLTALHQRSGEFASRPASSVNLYADAVARHAETRLVAFAGYHPRRGWEVLTFADLHRRATAVSNRWRKAGVTAATRVAILLPPGPAFVIAWAAALRVGAVASVLLAPGRRLLARQLAALDPTHVVFDPVAPPPLDPRWLPLALGLEEVGAVHVPGPHSYAPDEPCAALVSPFVDPVLPRPLTAARAFMVAARDAMLMWRLAPGAALCAPCGDEETLLPSILLATALIGATWVHIPEASLRGDLTLLDARRVDTAVLNDRARALLGGSAVAARRWSCVRRAVEEPLDWAAWKALVDAQGLTKTAAGNVIVDSACGGAIVGSATRPGSFSARALPCAGERWKLRSIEDPAKTATGAGVFTVLQGEKPLFPPWFILGTSGAEYLFGGTVTPRRRGRVVPVALVVEVASSTPSVLAAALLSEARQPGSDRFVLVLMTGDRPIEVVDAAELRDRLRAELGPIGEPDAIEVFPGYPRRIGGKVDLSWLSGQYRSGLLQKKASDPAAAALRHVRAALTKR